MVKIVMAISVSLSAILLFVSQGPVIGTTPDLRTQINIKQTQLDLELINECNAGLDIPEQTYNHWLKNEAGSNLDKYGLGLKEAYKDGWGRPLIAIKNKLTHNGEIQGVAFYSLGEDGQSMTNGNDPDDINSWDPNCGKLYRDRQSAERIRERERIALYFIFGNVGVLVVALGLRRKQQPDIIFLDEL